MNAKYDFLRRGKSFTLLLLPIVCFLLFTLRNISHAETSNPAIPDAQDRCPVCGMFVAKYPNWLAQISFQDNKIVFFDGVKDLMKYYFKISKYHKNRSHSDIKGIFVTDYYSTEPIAVTGAYFVIGSDVYGPMGKEFIPHKTRGMAEEFLKDHYGSRILLFNEIKQDVLDSM